MAQRSKSAAGSSRARRFWGTARGQGGSAAANRFKSFPRNQYEKTVRMDGFFVSVLRTRVYVLAYMPEKRDEYRLTDYSDTILPEGIETAPKRFAISYRNKWMIEQSDFVVTYVVHDAASGAAQFKKLAERKGKKVVELSRV